MNQPGSAPMMLMQRLPRRGGANVDAGLAAGFGLLRGKALFDATTAGSGKTDPAALAAFERETLPTWRRLGVPGPEK